MKTLLDGNSAASLGAALSRVEVIAAYPITPQTSVVEELSAMCASGKLKARFIMVESEHSALASVVGASTAGARTFTATSSQGLLLMHEILHWAAGARVPLVMVNVNRAVAPGWNIWADQTDSLSQRDTGWIQVYCGSAQEVLDSVIIAYRVAERVNVPVMISYDAFYVSHTQEVVDVISQDRADAFLGENRKEGYIDFESPSGIGSLTFPEEYAAFRKNLHNSIKAAGNVFREEFERFDEISGRSYSSFDYHRGKSNEALLVTAGAMGGNMLVAKDLLEKRGIEVGVLNLRVLRPFPSEEFREIGSRYKRVIVVERNLSPGSGGIIYSELISSVAAELSGTRFYNMISGLGGIDATPSDIAEGVIRLLKTGGRDTISFLEEICRKK